MQRIPDATRFARQMFAHAELFDLRLNRSLVALVSGMARHAAGKITQIFSTSCERERAYRLLENASLTVLAVMAALTKAVANIIKQEPFAYLAIDGSSLNLTDRGGRKGFGPIGNSIQKSCGLKVISAYALNACGVPLGVLFQKYWVRIPRSKTSKAVRNKENCKRKTADKETQHWLDIITESLQTIAAKKLWFLIDREGDSRDILLRLMSSKAHFTLRSSWDRLLENTGEDAQPYLRAMMRTAPCKTKYEVVVPPGNGRRPRIAKMQARVARVSLKLRDRQKSNPVVVSLHAIWACEVSQTKTGDQPLDWMLFTNAPISTEMEIAKAIYSYTLRWRIEDFHRAWKSGHCNVEDTQLRSVRAATIFAVMQAAVAAKVERMKHLARNEPDASADGELSLPERQALAALVHHNLHPKLAPGGRRQQTKTAPDPENMSIGIALYWLAILGGYTGKSSGGPPGTATINRGYAIVNGAVKALAAVDNFKKFRKM